MKKKILALLVAVATLLSSVFVGCTTPEEESPYADRPITVEFAYYYAGYGDAHYQAVAKDFMDNCNDQIYLKLVPYDNTEAARTNIQADSQEGDIVQLSVDMFRKQNYLEEISAVYDLKPYGESGTINDKDPTRKEYFTENYKDSTGAIKQGVFQFPSSRARGGYNFAYNATVLDALYPNGYELPRTTDEFFAFGDDLRSGDKNAYLTSAAIKDIGGGDYLTYLPDAWFGQLVGIDNYNAFYKGQYLNENGEWVLDETTDDGLKFLSDRKTQIEYAYELLDTLFEKDNEYLHRASAELDYLANDKVFAGAGYKTMKEKTAFLYIGSWLEKELAPLVEDGTVDKCEYGVMRVPVASAIVNQLDFVGTSTKYAGKMDDVTLSNIIKAIDEGKDYSATKSAVSGIEALSEKDFNRIKEARKMVSSSCYSNIVVPKIKDESKRQAIYDVLAYFASDRAQKVSAEAMGGLGMMPFGNFDTNELECSVSRYVREANAIGEDMILVDTAHVDNIFNVHVTVKWYHLPSGRITAYIYNGKAGDLTPTGMYNQTLAELKTTWDGDIEDYRKAISNTAN